MNADVSRCTIAALGGSSIYVFEQVYLVKKTIEDTDWIQKLILSKLSFQFVGQRVKAAKILTEISR